MTRRLLSACLGAAAFVGVLSVSARAAAKPPDLPMNQTDTVKPQTAQIADDYDDGLKSEGGGCIITGEESRIYSSKAMQDESAAELLFTLRVYDALPVALPTPTLYQLRPTARRTLAGSLLFGFNPLLSLLPTDKALDTPHDHPQRVAGEDVFSDLPWMNEAMRPETPPSHDYHKGETVWWKWCMSCLTTRHPSPAPEQNEGYINTIHPITDIAALTAVDAPAEIDAPLVPTAEALPMPKENKPHKKKHKKHHPKAEPLPMPQEDTADGMTCPYLRQQAADRHACQFADPQIGRDVLDNLESLTIADKLLEIAEEFAQAGCLREAFECCTLAQDLCPGSPCADRAAGALLDLYVRACAPATGSEETTEKPREKRSTDHQAIEKKLNRPVSVNFNDVPLKRVIDDLRAFHSINIYVDMPALAEKGISLDTPITIKVEQVAFKSALNLIVHLARLTYVVEDDVVHITTEEHARGKLMQRIYSVADLLEHKELSKCYKGKSRKDGKSNSECLIELITSTILPGSWGEQGGPGAIDYFPRTQSLVINQTADVQDQIADLLAALRRHCDEERKKETPCAEVKTTASDTVPGVEQQVGGLMKACRLLMNEGLHAQAAELARQAFAMDPERVMADPLIYKMHLLATTTPQAGSSESSEPPACPYCPQTGKPIPGIVPNKKKTQHVPTTFLVPVMPPVDYEVVPALDRVLTESAEKDRPEGGAEEVSEEAAPSSLDELIEAMMGGPGHTLFGFGVNADGSLRLTGEQTVGTNVYHVLFNRGCLAVWKTSDAAKTKP